MTQFFCAAALVIALLAAAAGVTQASSLVLRQPSPPYYWPRHDTALSGRYRRDQNTWIIFPASRTTYTRFRGGGIGFGK